MGVSTILSCSIVPNRTGTVPNRACLVAPNRTVSPPPAPPPPAPPGGVRSGVVCGWVAGVEGLEGGSGRVESVPNRTAPNIRIPK